MKTVIYDTINQVVLHNGKRFKKGQFYGTKANHLAVLDVVENAPPSYNSETHKLNGFEWVVNLSDATYTQTWRLVPLTAKELAAREWKHVEYSKKLSFDVSLLNNSIVQELVIDMVVLNDHPKEIINETFSIWGDSAPSRFTTAIQNAVQAGTATIQNRPAILND